MPVVGRYFPTQKPGEKIFLLLRRHWFTYLAFMVIGLIMSIPLVILFIYLIVYQQNFLPVILNISILVTSAYSLLIIGLLLYGFIDYYLDVYIVTNERIVNIEQNGFFKRKISELHLHQIQDVNAEVKGTFATLMHFGDIHIQTAGELDNFTFKAVPNPYRISKIIVDLQETILEAEYVEAKRGKNRAAKETGSEDERTLMDPKIAEKSPLNLNSLTSKLARSRTKRFLKGAELEETEFENKIQDEIKEQRNDDILKRFKEDRKKKVFDNITKNQPESKINLTEKKPSNRKKSKKAITGEMHENEEIDI